jgi:hypothetical protein
MFMPSKPPACSYLSVWTDTVHQKLDLALFEMIHDALEIQTTSKDISFSNNPTFFLDVEVSRPRAFLARQAMFFVVTKPVELSQRVLIETILYDKSARVEDSMERTILEYKGPDSRS